MSGSLKNNFARRQQLEEKLKNSSAALKRQITNMRDRLHAPIITTGIFGDTASTAKKSL